MISSGVHSKWKWNYICVCILFRPALPPCTKLVPTKEECTVQLWYLQLSLLGRKKFIPSYSLSKGYISKSRRNLGSGVFLQVLERGIKDGIYAMCLSVWMELLFKNLLAHWLYGETLDLQDSHPEKIISFKNGKVLGT